MTALSRIHYVAPARCVGIVATLLKAISQLSTVSNEGLIGPQVRTDMLMPVHEASIDPSGSRHFGLIQIKAVVGHFSHSSMVIFNTIAHKGSGSRRRY